LSFIATANAVAYTGAVPVFADVAADTLNLTPATVAAALTERTRAVIVVHQGGTPADLDAIRSVCDPAGVRIVEDAACAVGSEYMNAPIGSHSDFVTFSFHPRKIITTGEGGMLVLADAGDAERARGLREHGTTASAASRHTSRTVILEEYREVGYNYRMTDVQAAIGLAQLGKLDRILARRRELADAYHALLQDIPGLTMARDPACGRSNFQSFWVLLPDDFPVSRDDVLQALLDEGIAARRGIMAAHLEPAYSDRVVDALPVTERLTRNSVILPLFHAMTTEDQRRVVRVVRETSGVPVFG
jgi:perosamine synthetase